MCFGQSGAAKKAQEQSTRLAEESAAEARRMREDTERRELQRQQRITEGAGRIGDAFSQFNDDFYGRFKNAAVEAALPQVDQQYRDSRNTAFNSLAARGLLESSVGNKLLGDIENKFALTRGQIANEALSQASGLRGKVESARSDLSALNQQAGDPASLAAAAAGRATALQTATPQQIQVGDVFGSLLAPFAQYASAASRRIQPLGATNDGFRGPNNTSFRVIN